MADLLEVCTKGNVFDFINAFSYQNLMQTCTAVRKGMPGILSFINMSKCYGIKNTSSSGCQKQQCTCNPKGKIGNAQFCGNHLKKVSKDNVFSVPVSAIKPQLPSIQESSEAEVWEDCVNHNS